MRGFSLKRVSTRSPLVSAKISTQSILREGWNPLTQSTRKTGERLHQSTKHSGLVLSSMGDQKHYLWFEQLIFANAFSRSGTPINSTF